MTLIGGVGTLFGPMLGSSLVVWIHHVLGGSVLSSWISVILGVIFVLCVLLFRDGIVGYLQKFIKRNLR